MDPQVRSELLLSMDSGRLCCVCGAGLSMPFPSLVPSAAAVSGECFDKLAPLTPLDPAIKWELGDLSEHFHAADRLDFFLTAGVPWEKLNGPPNNGHAAIGDFLMTGAAHSAISANYDDMIERWIKGHRVDFRASLDGDAAAASAHPPLLKFHGCISDRLNTVWCVGQLADATISNRIARSTTWMNLHLQDKDFLFVGFFSDWDYLNDLFDALLASGRVHRVFLVNPEPLESLRAKAPTLAAILDQNSVVLRHIPVSSDEFLDDLRTEFSRAWLSRALDLGAAGFNALSDGEATPAPFLPLASDVGALYALRCDAEGATQADGARTRRPGAQTAEYATAQYLLQNKGANWNGDHWLLGGDRIRVLNGNGQMLSQVRAKFSRDEPPALAKENRFVVTSTTEYDVPADIVRDGEPGSIVRPQAPAAWDRFTPEVFG